MFRTALAAAAAILATAAISTAAAQGASPVRQAGLSAAGHWAVVRAGEGKVSHCVMGVRSDAAAPQPGKPQFMISADDQFVILRVRAAEWAFTGSRDIAVTLATAEGRERQPAAAVHGADLIDIAFGTESERMDELAASGHLEIRTEGTIVRLPLAASPRCCRPTGTAWRASASPRLQSMPRHARAVRRTERPLLVSDGAIPAGVAPS